LAPAGRAGSRSRSGARSGFDPLVAPA
jgi:hypothetical protein